MSIKNKVTGELSNITTYGVDGRISTITVPGNVNANAINVTSLSNLGNVANIVITGGNAGQAIITDGAGNLSWGNAGSSVNGSVPAVYFTAIASANNQVFSNVVLNAYTTNTDMTVFYNGALLPSEYYTVSGGNLTVNTIVNFGDTIDVIRQVAANIINVTSGYGDSNVQSLLAGGVTSNVITYANVSGGYLLGNGAFISGLPAGYSDVNVTLLLNSGTIGTDIITTGNISGDYFLGNGSQLTGLPVSYTNSNVTTLLSSGNITSNVITTGNISGNYYSGNGRFLTGLQPFMQVPAVYLTSPISGNNQSLSNVILSNYTANTAMTVFVNGVLLENTYYTLAADTLTVNTYLNAGDSIDVIAQFSGDINTVTSGYGNSNVAAFFTGYAGNIIPAVNEGYDLGAPSLAWKNVFAANLEGDTVTTTGNITSGGRITGQGLTINGDTFITGNANIQGTLTYNDVSSITTANLIIGLGNTQSGINVSGGGITIGSTDEATFLYNEPAQTWDSNIGIDVAGNVTAPYFIGDGTLLTGLYNNTNVRDLLASGNVSSNIATSGNFIGDGSELTNLPIATSIANSTTRVETLSNGNISLYANNTFIANLDQNGLGVNGAVYDNVGKLLPATITTPTPGQVLAYNGSAWVNTTVPESKFSGSVLLPPGQNLVNFTVPTAGTYTVWLTANIPNGIIVWNATITLTNPNVPVIGTQYGWWYNASGIETLRLTTMPNQVVGVNGQINTDIPVNMYIPTNVFNFGVNNLSGSFQTANYGWTKIS